MWLRSWVTAGKIDSFGDDFSYCHMTSAVQNAFGGGWSVATTFPRPSSSYSQGTMAQPQQHAISEGKHNIRLIPTLTQL